ncbi:MAG: hypothetical protein EOP53_08755 [Sphingobacteriales bacterium]|nr:MAG: hypothetical protein EOP53_08755 [Sphingobacteriales bacterium]
MQEPAKDKGWDIISGSANYTDGEQKGLATLLTATGGGQMASVVLMTNSSQYQNELLGFINSLQLSKPSLNETTNINPATNNSSINSIVGLWVDYTIETSGYSNGFPTPSGGYFRKEYAFNSDGTYLFRMKNWAVFVKEIQYVYESGHWKLNGNKLTITPKQGKGGWWHKAKSNRTHEWGSMAKSGNWKLESVTYTVDLNYYIGGDGKKITLQSNAPTEREGIKDNNRIVLNARGSGESLIDNPPGFSTGVENKSAHTSAKPATQGNTINAPITGKIWQAQSLEKHGAAYGNMSGFHTGGFWLYQYKFNKDGTYHFVYNAASAVANNPVNVLQYETGTYAVNGSSVTITPASGANEEWSVGKINNGMSAETIRKVLETRVKRLKSTTRKLEKITYPFSVEYWQGNEANALCLKHTQDTQREGSPGQNDQSCFFETTAAKAEKFNSVLQ